MLMARMEFPLRRRVNEKEQLNILGGLGEISPKPRHTYFVSVNSLLPPNLADSGCTGRGCP
jgi:hypothetical protein